MKTIEFRNVTKMAGNRVITDNANFTVSKGSFHLLVGNNGAGKTTIIRQLLNLYQERTGEILINGIDNKDPKSMIGVCFMSTNPKFPNNLSVKQYLESIMKTYYNFDSQKSQALIRKYLELFNITHIRDQNVSKCSTGEKKKTIMIQALVMEPNLFILDEPLANLDPSTKDEVIKWLVKLRKDFKTTIFISSHNLEMLKKIANEATVVSSGKVNYSGKVTSGTLLKIFNQNL